MLFTVTKSGKMRSEEKMDKTKILVVDDESRMRKLVKDFLVRQGYTVLEAADGMGGNGLFFMRIKILR